MILFNEKTYKKMKAYIYAIFFWDKTASSLLQVKG